MKLFKVILLTIFFITPLKANTIYNLIKIPNLEIYQIDKKNQLRYLYASSSFRLGVKKNIVCMNSTKKDYDKKFKLISHSLNRYSRDFLKKINLRYIVMCENLSISGINTAGIPDSIMKTLILDIKFNKKYFKRTIHHEVFHIINDSFKELFNEDEWVKFNNKNFKYADCSTCTKKLGLNTYTNTSGFFTEYSQSTPSEDMAETFSHIMTLSPKKLREVNDSDNILKNKVEFIKYRLLKIYKDFNFPGNLKTSVNLTIQ